MNDNRSIELKSLNPINQGITSPHSYPKVDSPHQYPTAQTEAPQVSDCTAYESLPCDKASDRSGAPLVLKQEKYNPVYGSGGGATSTSFKGNASKKPPLPYRSNGTNKRRSSTIACVAASVILCLALLVSIAAILLAIFMILGLIPLPTSSMSEEIQRLERDYAQLQADISNLMNSTKATTAPPPAPTTSAPPIVSIEVVDYNNCTVLREQKTLRVGQTTETIILTTNVSFIDGNDDQVVVDNICYFVNISGSPTDLSTNFHFNYLSALDLMLPQYSCTCSGVFTSTHSAVCVFYYRACFTKTVYAYEALS